MRISEYTRTDDPAEHHAVHVSRTVVSALQRALNAARNRAARAKTQAEQIEKVLASLNGQGDVEIASENEEE